MAAEGAVRNGRWLPKLLDRGMTLPELRMRAAILQHLEQGHAKVHLKEVIYRLFEAQPGQFAAAAMSLIDTHQVESVVRMLADVLMDSAHLMNHLCAPERFERGEVLQICRDMMQLAPLFDIKLAKLLPSRRGEEPKMDVPTVLFVLDILNEISDGPRLVLLLNHLGQHSDQRIASKALLLLGSRFRNRHWLKRHIQSADPRARANLVEGLWGDRSPAAIKTFSDCLVDANNRVVGNALVGLMLAGDGDAVQKARRMLSDERPSFRWTAAWVLGRSGDPESLAALRPALEDSEHGVREAAQRAIAALLKRFPAQEIATHAPEPLPESLPEPEQAPNLAALTAALEDAERNVRDARKAIAALAGKAPAQETTQPPSEPLSVPAAASPEFEIRLDGHFAARRRDR
jgi:hypothetical protein